MISPQTPGKSPAAIRKVATADDLVLTKKNWRVACSVGVRFSEIFRNKLQMTRVKAGW